MKRGRGGDVHVTHGNHAHRLPDAEADTGRYAAVQALEAVGLVNVLERVADRHLLGAVGVGLLALHLDADDLDGLVPGRQATANGRGGNLLGGAERLALALARDVADALLGHAAEAEARAPVGHLADGHGVDALVDAADALLAVNVHERGPRALRGRARRHRLVLGDLDRLHARAEAHGRVRLRHAARHAADDAAAEIAGPERLGVVLGLGGDEEEHGALGRGFNPGPRDQALVDWSRGREVSGRSHLTREGVGVRTAEGTAAAPDAAEGRDEAVAAVGGHGGLDDLERLAEGGDLEQVEAGAEEQVGKLDGLLLEVLGRSRDGGDSGGHGLAWVNSTGP